MPAGWTAVPAAFEDGGVTRTAAMFGGEDVFFTVPPFFALFRNGIGKQLFRAKEFQVMEGLVSPPVFIGLYPGYPESNHPVGRQGEGKDIAVYIHHAVEGDAAPNFLCVSFGKNDEILVYEHEKKHSREEGGSQVNLGVSFIRGLSPTQTYRESGILFVLFIIFSEK
jgi:hypothetical protein